VNRTVDSVELARFVGSELKLLEGYAARKLYGQDAGDIPEEISRLLFNTLPEIVAQPGDAQEAASVLQYAQERGIPVTPRGSASYALGGTVPIAGGIIIDLSGWQDILELDKEALTITVQAGVRWADLDDALRGAGLALRTYPSSYFSTVAGWVATGGHGIGSLKYGRVYENIQALEVITPRGEVKTLQPSDPGFRYFLGTEGQMGLVSKVTLKVRPRPAEPVYLLFYFEDAQGAFAFISDIIQQGLGPYHIKYMEAGHMAQVNRLLGWEIAEELDAVLLGFDGPEETAPLASIAASRAAIPAPDYLAGYLWKERLFPMKTKRLGPDLLASEVLMPLDRALPYLEAARSLGRRLATEVASEMHVISREEALIMATFLSDSSRRIAHLVHLLLVLLLTKLGINHGGRPYGLGIWNTPFLLSKYAPQDIERLRAYKQEVDPNGVLNPGKFFAIRSRLWNLPVQVFRPAVLEAVLATSRLWGVAVRHLPRGRERSRGANSPLRYAITACARCGSCVPVCPAYMVTHDETVTARGKLLLSSELLQGKGPATREEAQLPFLCMHCGACEEVCQSELDLLSAWEELEAALEARYGRPAQAVEQFVTEVEANERYWDRLREVAPPALTVSSRQKVQEETNGRS
jgi:FAD/FMN-containing dehydrogenase/ferredoxin